MKCIKAIRETKDVKLGEIRRVDEKTAYNMVGVSWMYISKSEWKSSLGTKSEPSRNQVDAESELMTEQVEKKPYKKGERSDKHKNKKN